jgi:hypothetical protein
MGSNPLAKKKIKVEELSEIERLLYESYRKIDVDFTFNEVTTLKLKLTDDKFYFHTEFSFLLFFNNSIFTENINQIYKNFNTKIESFINSSSNKKFFNVLLIIDDEIETLKSGAKIDFDGLFTIAFERMEIFIMLYIDVTNCHPEYVTEFMKQLCENSILYRSGRKFDCVYILLPNTDYIVKNSQTITFVTTRSDYNLFEEEENNLYELLNFDSFSNFLKCKYPPTSSNNQFSKFIRKVKPVSTCSAIYIDFNFEISEFPNENLYQFITIEILTSECPENIMYIYINNDFNYNPNFDLFINKVMSSFDQATDKFKDRGVFLKIKILLVNSSDPKRNKAFLSTNLLSGYSYKNNTNTNNNKNENKFKLKDVETKVHELICKKFQKKTENLPYNSTLIFQFNEILDNNNTSKKESKQSKYRKTTIKYKFTKPKQANKKEYESLILALAKKNYLNKLINKDNIKENKINLKLLQFLGVKKIKENDDLINDKNINNDKNDDNKENNNNLIGDDNNAIKKSFENGLEFEINYEEKEEVVKDFENQFFKSL